MKWLDDATRAAVWRRLQALGDRERWRGMLTRDVGLKLVSLGVAFGLWAFVNASERDTEQGLQVPLELRSIPPALMVISPRVDFIDLRVSGPRTLLSRIDRKRLAIPLDLAGVRPGPAVFRVGTDALNLPRGVKILRVTPAQVTLDLERVLRRTVPVRLQYGKLNAGLRIEEARVTPESIEVIGPASAVEDVKAVDTEPLDLKAVTAGTLQHELALPEIGEYVTLSETRVVAQVHVIEVEIERELRGVAVSMRRTAYRAAVEPAKIRLTVRGPKRAVESLVLEHGEVYIDAAGLTPGRYERTPKVDLPPDLELVRLEPALVQVRLSKGK